MSEVKIVTIPEAEFREMLVESARIGGQIALNSFLVQAKKFDPAKYGSFMKRRQVAGELNCSTDKVDDLIARGVLKRAAHGGSAVLVTTESVINYLFLKK